MKTRFQPLVLAVSACLLLGCGGGGGGSTTPTTGGGSGGTPTPPTTPTTPTTPSDAPTFSEVSVHDTSVLKVGSEFYIFGSHLAAAKSSDLMKWTKVADGVTNANPLISNVLTELKETFDWAEASTLWATDVIQLADGKFYMYYNACKGDSPRSALGVAVADSVEGPYKNKQILLKSGMWGEASPDGTVYDAQKHPNVVDPDVFFDKNGRLWMLYGSYSGGLFILELDKTSGLPLPEQGYGKHLMGGNHSRIEGGYVLYSPDSDYYYLFVSFGGLDAAGGYNIRVSRSSNPEGPYFDALGNDMASVKSDPAKTLFDDASIAPYAEKLMGNHQFTALTGETTAPGYVSPGHNSAWYDETKKQYFLIFHSRFPGRGEQHEVRVHQMFINSEGWPVVAPLRYAPPADSSVAASAVAGTYQLIDHGKDISATVKTASTVTLTADGKVSGSQTGSWVLEANQQLKLVLDGAGQFDGVVSKQWHQGRSNWAVTFSVLSDQGRSLWAVKNP